MAIRGGAGQDELAPRARDHVPDERQRPTVKTVSATQPPGWSIEPCEPAIRHVRRGRRNAEANLPSVHARDDPFSGAGMSERVEAWRRPGTLACPKRAGPAKVALRIQAGDDDAWCL